MKRGDFIKKASFGAVAVAAVGPTVPLAIDKLNYYQTLWKSGIIAKKDAVDTLTLWPNDPPFLQMLANRKRLPSGDPTFKFFGYDVARQIETKGE